jgi:hypothetical protein
MVKNVKTNHAGIEMAVVCIVIHYRISLSKHDIIRNIKPG